MIRRRRKRAIRCAKHNHKRDLYFNVNCTCYMCLPNLAIKTDHQVRFGVGMCPGVRCERSIVSSPAQCKLESGELCLTPFVESVISPSNVIDAKCVTVAPQAPTIATHGMGGRGGGVDAVIPRPTNPATAVGAMAHRVVSECRCDWLKVKLMGKTVMVTASDCYGRGGIVTLHVTNSCVLGLCTCVYAIAGQPAQFKPCRIFTESFRFNELDSDWEFVLRGALFGFKVINTSCLHL